MLLPMAMVNGRLSLNRMTFMPTLINATVLTDDRRFITKAWDLIHDWIVAHPQIDERPSTRTLDTDYASCSLV
ncbi:hypothetical protein MGH68_03430 [Erysipelothrix sp. D19-032]